MTIRTGTSFQIERHPRDLAGAAPIVAYWMLESGTTYVLGSGDETAEADAWLKEETAGVFVLDSDIAEKDRALYHVSATEVIT